MKTRTHTLSWQNNGNESFWKREKNEKMKNFPVGYFGLVYLVGLWNAANVCIILGQKTKKKKNKPYLPYNTAYNIARQADRLLVARER